MAWADHQPACPGARRERLPVDIGIRNSRKGCEKAKYWRAIRLRDALRHRIGQFVRPALTEVAPNSWLMQDILQHDGNSLYRPVLVYHLVRQR